MLKSNGRDFGFRPRVAAGNFCIMGTIGSGKTLTMRSLMASVLRQIDADSDRHAVILDKAQDMTDFLQRREVSCPIYNLNPFDPTGFGWDIASDWTEPSMARHYAELLIPDPTDYSSTFYLPRTRKPFGTSAASSHA